MGGLGGSAPQHDDGRPGEAAPAAEQGRPEDVGDVEALTHPSRPARRLLEMAGTWPESLPSELPSPTQYRIHRQLGSAEVDVLVAAYRAGATTKDLATRFGIHHVTVGRHLAARGIDTKPPGLHPHDVPAAAELYRAGWSLARIAEKFNTTADSVRRRLLEVGVQMRRSWER